MCRNKALQTMFSMLGKSEKAGSGVDKILQGWKDNNWSRPEVSFSLRPDKVDLMLYIRELLDIAQVSDQATDQVSDQASDQASDQVSENGDNISAKIIAFCVEPRTTRQIMEHLRMNNRTYLRNTYIIPLLGSRLRMTQPDKPNHPNQMYVAI